MDRVVGDKAEMSEMGRRWVGIPGCNTWTVILAQNNSCSFILVLAESYPDLSPA
jgi:hypothetical protein